MTKASDNEFPSVLFDEQAGNPSTPASGFWRAYFKSDGLYAIDDAGAVTGPFGAGGGAAFGGDITEYYAVYKAANEVVNNSTVLQNDDDLLVALGASEVWRFEIDLFYSAAGAADLKVAITVPASATLRWWAPQSTNASASGWGASTVTGSGTTRDFEAVDTTNVRGLHIIGVVINSTNAGDLQLQWAQNTANASDATVYAGSALRAERVA